MADALVAALIAALGERGVLSAPDDLTRYQRGWRYGAGVARCVVRPQDTGEVAEALRICAEHGVRVVPQGANTGLVAASTPDESGQMVVLSLERLDATVEVDADARTALVDGGVLLSTLNERLARNGLWFPVDLGADPQIGGMVATNTGGTRLLKYGDVRHNLLGLEVVLGDGRVVSQLNRLRKNNTGLDAKQLFVGTTGVFAVVTKAVLHVAPLPTQRATALVACSDGDAAVSLLRALERQLGDVLSAYEVMGEGAMAAVLRHHPDLRPPFDPLPRYAALVELSTTLPQDALLLGAALERALAAHVDASGGAITDALVGDAEAYWGIRHRISESLARDGEMAAFDVSVARSQLPAFTDRVRALLSDQHPDVWLCDYGHWGDGGSHLCVLWHAADVADGAAKKAALQDAIYELAVREFGGSYSAEHGVGPHNQRYYDRYTDDVVQQLCAAIGAFCDPGDRLGTVRLGG